MTKIALWNSQVCKLDRLEKQANQSEKQEMQDNIKDCKLDLLMDLINKSMKEKKIGREFRVPAL